MALPTSPAFGRAARLTALALFAVLTAATATAQAPAVVLNGRVTDAETGGPLPGAHVFIATSTIGTTTRTDGTYELGPIPVGAMRLYVSMLGYEPEARDLLLRSDTPRTFDFALTPAILEVGEVVVEAKRDRRWKQRLERFTGLFIGETTAADETRILNPEVLDFDVDQTVFKAVAAEPLIIENRALGYRIQYFLKDFEAERGRTKYDGEPLFEELEPINEEERLGWEARRRKAFVGSFRHFLLALIAGQTEPQRFNVFGRTEMAAAGQSGSGFGPAVGTRFPADAADLLSPGEATGEYVLDFEGFREIVFTGEREDPAFLIWSKQHGARPGSQTSYIRLENGPTVVDYKGDVLDPYGVTLYGYYAFERVADQVPRDYRPS